MTPCELLPVVEVIMKALVIAVIAGVYVATVFTLMLAILEREWRMVTACGSFLLAMLFVGFYALLRFICEDT